MKLWNWMAESLGAERVDSVAGISPSLAAPWAHEATWLVALALLAALAAAIFFYRRLQPLRPSRSRAMLAGARAAILMLFILLLAEPTLVLKFTSHPHPALWLLFDGTDSMAIEDVLSDPQRKQLDDAVGIGDRQAESGGRQRIDYIRALFERPQNNLLERLEKNFRVKAFQFDRPGAAAVLRTSTAEGKPVDGRTLAQQLSTTGQVTALGSALEELAQRQATSNLAGVVVFSDFDQNAGVPAASAARQLGVPLYAVGIGPDSAIDLAVDLQAPPVMKKAERTSLLVTLRQTGLDGQTVNVRLTGRRLDGRPGEKPLEIGQRPAKLSLPLVTLDVPYTPEEIGRLAITATVEPLAGEVIKENNIVERDTSVRDDFLRLMYVEYEPTWEWRFIKEVFHRDRLVGERGFRTFLRSADPKVRQTNELFLATMTPARSEFFANDVIFLGDLPSTALSTRFCELVKEFVSTFGGGLVVLSGPEFGPGQLGRTPLADMLPVVVDADARRRDARPFAPRLSPYAAGYEFMQLGASVRENEAAWRALGELPWYQPSARVHPLATVLVEHPTDKCVDGKTPQPLVAVRRYGRGEVVFLAFNETWRLRRKYGEKFYRQFWGQMIHRLGLSHALGTQKRFVVRTDRQQYQVDDRVVLSVEAYDENFEPLAAEKLAQRKLWGELNTPSRIGSPAAETNNPAADDRQPLAITQSRPGLFETQIPVLASGNYTVKVKDPVTAEAASVSFQVNSLSAERRSAVRNVALEQELAAATGGKSYDLLSADRLPDEIRSIARTETSVEVLPLWNTWPCFVLVVGLLIAEWLGRKLVNLP